MTWNARWLAMKGDLKILCQFNGKSSNLMGYLWQATVKKMLADIQARGEEGALDWAKKLDGEDDEDTGGDDYPSVSFVFVSRHWSFDFICMLT